MLYSRSMARKKEKPAIVHTETPGEYFMRLGRIAAFGAGAYLLYLCVERLADVLFPVVSSLILAYLLSPLVDSMQKRRLPRPFGILIVLLVILGLAGSFAAFFYPTIAREVGNVAQKFPAVMNTIEKDGIPYVEKTFGITFPPTISEAIQAYSSNLGGILPDILKKVSSWVIAAVTQTGAIISSILNLILIPVFTFYFLNDFTEIKAKGYELLPAGRRDFLMERIKSMDAVVGNWLRGQIEVALILAILYGIGIGAVFYFSGLDTKTGFAIGILTGTLNVIPYMGAATGFLLSMMIGVIEWSGFGTIAGILCVFLLVQVLDGYFITPRVVGSKVGLGPVGVVLSLLTGGSLFGFFGILLAVPSVAALKVIVPDIMKVYRDSRFYNRK